MANKRGTEKRGGSSLERMVRPPCDCGSTDASWHGDRYGLRQYMCDKCWLGKTRIIGIGIPTHFRPTGANVSACGVECPERAAYDGRDTDCILCRQTKAWKRYMGV
jgi:hypothetical protein